MSDYLKLCELLRQEFIQKMALLNIVEKVPYKTGSAHINLHRLRAIEFAYKNRYETASENMTIFTQVMNGY